MRKFFAGLFMMIACLALAMAGGEPQGDVNQVWTCTGVLAVFAVSLYMVKRLSTKEDK